MARTQTDSQRKENSSTVWGKATPAKSNPISPSLSFVWKKRRKSMVKLKCEHASSTLGLSPTRMQRKESETCQWQWMNGTLTSSGQKCEKLFLLLPLPVFVSGNPTVLKPFSALCWFLGKADGQHNGNSYWEIKVDDGVNGGGDCPETEMLRLDFWLATNTKNEFPML